MAAFAVSLIIGAIIGWIGSLVMRDDTQATILVDIGVGAFVAVVASVALAQGYLLDSFLIASLAATLVVGLLAVLR